MAVIGFFVLPNFGGMNACLKLAMDLRGIGHEIHYLGLEDSQDYIQSNGFPFTPVFQKHFPKGFYGEHSVKQALPFGLDSLREDWHRLARFRAFFDDLLGGADREFIACLQALKPDLIVYASGDPYVEYPAIIAHSLGIKGVYFHDALWPIEASGQPPIGSDALPGNTLSSWLRIKLAWQWYYLQYSINFAGFRHFAKRLAAHYGCHVRAEHFPYRRHRLLRLPELLPFPVDFDLPGFAIPGQYYIEASICPPRQQCEFPWQRLEDGRPLLYCALGTYLWFGKSHYQRFFRVLIEASAMRPEWQWVFAIGETLEPEDLAPVPDNVILVKRAPQLDLLKRARIMITHGGANTIKECLYYGVPVIVFPLGADQPGNAARIRFHGLGLRADINKVSADYLRGLIETLDTNTYFHSQMKIMQAKIQRLEEEQPGVRLIETLLQA